MSKEQTEEDWYLEGLHIRIRDNQIKKEQENPFVCGKSYVPTKKTLQDLSDEVSLEYLRKLDRIKQRVLLDVPFEDNAEAKAAGAMFDGLLKCWYIAKKKPIKALQKFLIAGQEHKLTKENMK